MSKKKALLKDVTGSAIQIMELSSPHDVDGTTASAQSNAIDGEIVRICALDTDIRWLIASNPIALTTSHYLGQGKEIYQPIEVGYKVAVLGGKANISTAGV